MRYCRQDFLSGMSLMQLGNSDDEASRLFSRLDADNDGAVSLVELRPALARCTQADAPQKAHEAWASELFARIREAMDRRTDLAPLTLFEKLSKEGAAHGVAIDQTRFGKLLVFLRRLAGWAFTALVADGGQRPEWLYHF